MPVPPPDPEPTAQRVPVRPASGPMRWALIALAGVALVLAVVGVFLPGLPTVPFLLVAAWASARSSPRLHAWLLQHPAFGPLIDDWEQGGRVRRRAKWQATVAMALCAALLLWLSPRWWISALAVVSMAVVLAWLWRRPER